MGDKAGHDFVPKLLHDKRAGNFLKYLEYVGEYWPDNVRCEYPGIRRKYYEYKKSTSSLSVKSLLAIDSDWPFPDFYYKSIGSTVKGFSLFYPNLSDSLKNLIEPSPNLINTESETEETSTVPTQYSFYPGQQQIEEDMKSYNNVPLKYFINESYFLYDKSDLIKETYYCTKEKNLNNSSVSHFNKKKQKMRHLK